MSMFIVTTCTLNLHNYSTPTVLATASSVSREAGTVILVNQLPTLTTIVTRAWRALVIVYRNKYTTGQKTLYYLQYVTTGTACTCTLNDEKKLKLLCDDFFSCVSANNIATLRFKKKSYLRTCLASLPGVTRLASAGVFIHVVNACSQVCTGKRSAFVDICNEYIAEYIHKYCKATSLVYTHSQHISITDHQPDSHRVPVKPVVQLQEYMSV